MNASTNWNKINCHMSITMKQNMSHVQRQKHPFAKMNEQIELIKDSTYVRTPNNGAPRLLME